MSSPESMQSYRLPLRQIAVDLGIYKYKYKYCNIVVYKFCVTELNLKQVLWL